MNGDELLKLLREVHDGRVSPAEAESRLRDAPMADLGETKIDLHRESRCGFPEVVYAQGKTVETVEAALRALCEAGQEALATRVAPEQAEHLAKSFAAGEYNAVGRTFWVRAQPQTAGAGKVVVITAGTTDLPVGEEALVTAQWMGCEAHLVSDVGVAGPHRLPAYRDVYGDADAIVVVAGMEGALPSVVGGHVSCPVIAVPTSVGYGASFGGLAALLGMLNSCAANVTVVNIDAGFKGGYVAGLIAKRTALARSDE
jgi:NCAIR mutase (PurE)-related protein